MFQDAYNLVQWGGVSDAHILNITNYSKMPRYLMDPHSTYRPLQLDTTERLNDNDLIAWVSVISRGPVLILSCVCSGLRV